MVKRDKKNYDNMICSVCGGKDTYIYQGVPRWARYIDDSGRWDHKSYICSRCEEKIRQSRPDSRNSAIKSVSNWRTGELYLYSANGKGLIGEVIIAKVRRLEVLSILMDTTRFKFDLSRDVEYRIIQVKIATLRYGEWTVGNYVNEDIFDYLFIVCMDKHWKNVERIYAIPFEEISSSGVSIREKPLPSRGSKWEKFRIDEMQYNDSFHSLMEFLNGKKYFGIEDIKKWLMNDGEKEELNGDEKVWMTKNL